MGLKNILISTQLIFGLLLTNTAERIKFRKKLVRNIWKASTEEPFGEDRGLDFAVTDDLYERACRDGMGQTNVYINPRPACDDIATYTIQYFSQYEKNFNLVRCSGFPGTFYLCKLNEENYDIYWQKYAVFTHRSSVESSQSSLESSRSLRAHVPSSSQFSSYRNPYRH